MNAPARRTPAAGTAGFTIPEILIAILIITVGIIAMMGTSTATQKLISRARRTTLATQVADGIMDSLRLKSNDNLQTCTGLASDGTGYGTQGITVTWSVGSRTAIGTVGVRPIMVMVTYQSMGRMMYDTLTSVFKCDA